MIILVVIICSFDELKILNYYKIHLRICSLVYFIKYAMMRECIFPIASSFKRNGIRQALSKSVPENKMTQILKSVYEVMSH